MIFFLYERRFQNNLWFTGAAPGESLKDIEGMHAMGIFNIISLLGGLSTLWGSVLDDATEDIPPEIAALDEKLFSSPALALNSVYRALSSLLSSVHNRS